MLLVEANLAYSAIPFSFSGNKLESIKNEGGGRGDFDSAFELLGSEM